jgi:hypothetical protein
MLPECSLGRLKAAGLSESRSKETLFAVGATADIG